MANVSGIAIVIKAFLPTGKTLDEQFAALSIVKDAHASSDYSALLSAAQIDEVKTEQKVRRIEDAPAVPLASGPSDGSDETSSSNDGQVDEATGIDGNGDPTWAEIENGALDDELPISQPEPDEPAPARRKRA